MDEELKTYLEGKFADVSSQFADVRAEFVKIRAEIADVRTEIEATETRLLSEFWKWGRVSDQRIRRVEQSDATTVERMAAIEDRLFTLERKVAGSKG